SRVIVTGEMAPTTTPIVNSNNLSLSGNALISQGNWKYDLILDSLSGDWTLQQDQVVDQNLYLASSTLDLNGKTLTVKGDLIHSGGTLTVTGGTLVVDGDYRIQTASTDAQGATTYKYSSGTLNMTNSADNVLVHGNFVMDSYYGHGALLTSGTLEVKGDFTQKSTVSSSTAKDYINFQATGTHRVLLSGTAKQTVSFSTASCNRSHFNILEITNDTNAGILFSTGVVITQLFNHHLNDFTISSSSQFPDYDLDEILDHNDPDPLNTYTCDHESLKTLYRDFDNDGYGDSSRIMYSCTSLEGYAENIYSSSKFEAGDINCDNEVNMVDSVLALKLLSGKGADIHDNRAADMNKDGKIGIEEAVHIINLNKNR
ncbi:dockerin type I repeat-containing protein, partial [Desulfobacter latus]